MKCVSFILILIPLVTAWGQNQHTTSVFGNLTIEWTLPVQQLYITAEDRNCFPGDHPPAAEYCAGNRVQLHYGKDRNEAEKKLKEARALFSERIVNLDYEQPDYKVKVGYFSSRETAQKFLNQAKLRFPSSLVTNEQIRCILISD